jgi:hypothetical protein
MKIILRSSAVTVAVGVGLSLAALPAGPATAAGGTRVPCNDITALKNAITQANTGGGRIVLASHCTYTLTTPDNTDDGLPEITGNVTITGRDTTIRRSPSATQDFRILHVVSGGNLTLNSLTISGGRLGSGPGGGIATQQGTLNLNRSVITRNRADTGGGLSNLSGKLNLDRSTVSRNTADRFGGGILNDGSGTLTMKHGALFLNRAVTSNGGGLENIVGTASLESVSVRSNTAIEGGGIRNANGSTVRTKSTILRDNLAVSGAGLSNNSDTASSRATLVRSLVTRNTAITAGGGVFNGTGGQVTLTNSRVIRNTPDNCAPAGSVAGCTNPTGTVKAPTKQLPKRAADIKARK